MKNASILVSGETNLSIRGEPNMSHAEGTKYSFIVLDPPWLNKSVRRKRVYAWSDFADIRAIPLEDLIDRQRPSLICCWSTNCDRIEEFIKTDLFPKWGCRYLTTWHWLKVYLSAHRRAVVCIAPLQVTRSGEPVLDLASLDKKSYETLILGYAGDEQRFTSLEATSKILCSVLICIHHLHCVSRLIHSRYRR